MYNKKVGLIHYLFRNITVYVCARARYRWRSEDNFVLLALSFHFYKECGN